MVDFKFGKRNPVTSSHLSSFDFDGFSAWDRLNTSCYAVVDIDKFGLNGFGLSRLCASTSTGTTSTSTGATSTSTGATSTVITGTVTTVITGTVTTVITGTATTVITGTTSTITAVITGTVTAVITGTTSTVTTATLLVLESSFFLHGIAGRIGHFNAYCVWRL